MSSKHNQRVEIFRSNEEGAKKLGEAVKYWSNSCGELHKNGLFDITEEELPVPLQRAYQELWGEDYGSYCYLVETPDGYGAALINEYDLCFAEDCGLTMDDLFETACQDAGEIAGHDAFENARVYVGEFSDFNECHDLIVVFPADTPVEAFHKAAKLLYEELAYATARSLDAEKTADSVFVKTDAAPSASEIQSTGAPAEYVMLSLDRDEIEQLARATGCDIRTKDDLRDAVRFALEKYVETYLPETEANERQREGTVSPGSGLIAEENGIFDDTKASFSSVYWLDYATLVYEFGSYVDDDGDAYDVNCEYHADDNTWHLLKSYDGDILTMNLFELPTEQRLRIMAKMIREGELNESIANIAPEEKFENATFVSVWDGGFCVETPCKVNRLTGEVTDIVVSEGTADFVNELDEEYIRMEDGTEHPVSNDPTAGGFWYGTDDSEIEEASLDAKIQAASEKARCETKDETLPARSAKQDR